MRAIPYGRQEIVEQDIRAVVDALRAPMLTQGPLVETFEKKIADTVGARFAVAFNSGTSAIHGAYFAAGLSKGASVLTSPITFVATANSSVYLNGGVHFADVEADVPLLAPASVRSSEAKNVRVLAPVHLCGHVADMEALSAIARERGWLIVEDAAHALGARYSAQGGSELKVGACAHSDMCCFSFHPVKHITTGEGGAVTTNSEAFYEKLKRFRTHGITRDPALMTRNDGPWYYEQHELGFNYRMTDFQSALGISQLTRLGKYVERRREIAHRYDEAFGAIADMRPVLAPQRSRSSYHLYVIRVHAQKRLQVFQALRESGIEVNVHYIPVYQQPYYRGRGFEKYSLPNSERYYSEAISIPMYPGLSSAEVDFVIGQILRQIVGAAATT